MRGTLGSPRFDAFADEQPISSAQILALSICAFALLLDGFDLFLVGNLAPAIADGFGVTPARLSLVFLLQQIGLAAGAFLISPLSDRIGRKPVLLACAASFGLLTLAAPLARSILLFGLLRGAAGIFLSGLIPIAIALLVEVTPPRRQGLFVSLAFTGYGAGAVGGALVGAVLLKHYGWQSGFWIGGILPLLYCGFAFRLIPAAVRPERRRHSSAAAITLTASGREIFRHGRAPMTCLLWAIFFLSSGTISLMFAWMPTFFVQRGGISLSAYSSVASFSLGGALLGTLTIGYLLDRFPSMRVVIVNFCLLPVAMTVLGHARFGTMLFPFALMAFSVFQGSAQTALSVVTTQLYPADIRATGTGWAFGAGRIGGILGPLLGGLMLASKFTVPQFFLATAVPMLVAVILLIALQRANAARSNSVTASASSGAMALPAEPSISKGEQPWTRNRH